MLAMILIAFIVYTYAYRMQKESTGTSTIVCRVLYGRDLSFYDWEAAKSYQLLQIKTDVGRTRTIQDCRTDGRATWSLLRRVSVGDCTVLKSGASIQPLPCL